MIIDLSIFPSVLRSGGLESVLRLCVNPSDTVALMAVSALGLLLEDPGSHTTVIDGDKMALQKLLKFAASDSPHVSTIQRVNVKGYYLFPINRLLPPYFKKPVSS